MYKRIFLFVTVLLLSLGIEAQVKVDRGYTSDVKHRTERGKTASNASQLSIRYGIKAGVNMSTMSNGMDFDPGFGMGVGFRVGGMANFHWGQRTKTSLPGTGWFGLQPELMYSYQSVKSDGGNINMSYLQVPVMLKVYPLAALSVEVGPEFNYLVATSPKDMTVDGATMKIGDCKGFNMGLGVGASYELRTGLVFGARYSLGFTDMAKNLKWKNNGNIQVTVGWLF